MTEFEAVLITLGLAGAFLAGRLFGSCF